MARRTPTFTMLDANAVSSGLQPDKHPLLGFLWEAAANVTFFAGKVKRRVPASLAFGPVAGAGVPRGLSQQQSANGTRWIWAALGGKVVRWYGAAVEEILTGEAFVQDQSGNAMPTYWDFTHYGDWTIINKGSGAARIYKDPGLTAYGDAPSDVLQFKKKLSFVLACGCGDNGKDVAWSDAQDVEVWTPTDSNAAGRLSIEEFETPIRAASNIGQSVSVFAEDQMAIVTYIGSPFWFGQKVVLNGIGCVGKNAVASDGNSNYGVGRGGCWWTDGNSYKYVDEGYLHDYLQRGVNWDQSAKIQVVRNDYTGCVEFFFPMGASLVLNEGWSLDLRNGGWSPIPVCAVKEERRLFRKPLLARDNAASVLLDEENPAAAAPLTLRTKPLIMQVQSSDGVADAHTDVRVDEVILLLRAASNVQFRLGSAEQSDQADYQWSEWFTLDASTFTYKPGAMASGVFWKLDFQSTADNWDLDLQGFQLFGLPEGSQRSQS